MPRQTPTTCRFQPRGKRWQPKRSPPSRPSLVVEDDALTVSPIADALVARDIGFIFVTGDDDHGLFAYRDRPTLKEAIPDRRAEAVLHERPE